MSFFCLYYRTEGVLKKFKTKMIIKNYSNGDYLKSDLCFYVCNKTPLSFHPKDKPCYLHL